MSSLPVDMNTLLQATFIPDEGIPVIYPQVADAAAQLGAMRVVCYRLLQILSGLDTPYNVSNAAQLGGHRTLRNFAISERYPQLELARVACCQLLQVLGPPYNVPNAAPIGENQVFKISRIYPQATLTVTQLEFVWDSYYQLLQVYGSLDDGSDATQFGGYQVLRGSEISPIYQVTLAATHLKFVLVACDQLLQVYGMLPGEYNATQFGVLTDNIHPPVPEVAQPTGVQEARAPAGSDTSGRSHCHYGDCKATFGRPQERRRHLIDVHTLRRQCPFCLYEWARPDKIRAHLMKKHYDELPQEILNEIRAKRGQHLVAFLTPLCNIRERSPAVKEKSRSQSLAQKRRLRRVEFADDSAKPADLA